MKKSELIKIVREVITAQPKLSGDVAAAEKAIDGNSTTSRALLRINSATEFMQEFEQWIQDLGITSTNSGDKSKTPVTKGTISSAVNKALADLNWK